MSLSKEITIVLILFQIQTLMKLELKQVFEYKPDFIEIF